MAASQLTKFDRFTYGICVGEHDLANDNLYLALIKSASNGGFTPSVSESDPRWGVGGSVDYSTGEVAAGGNYASGGIQVQNQSLSLASGVVTLNGDDAVAALDLSNPTNARWGILYNASKSGKCIALADFGSDVDGTQGDIGCIWSASGIATFS